MSQIEDPSQFGPLFHDPSPFGPLCYDPSPFRPACVRNVSTDAPAASEADDDAKLHVKLDKKEPDAKLDKKETDTKLDKKELDAKLDKKETDKKELDKELGDKCADGDVELGDQGRNDLCKSIYTLLSTPLIRIRALRCAQRKDMYIKNVFEQRLARVNKTIQLHDQAIDQTSDQLRESREEIAHLWQLQLLSLEVGQHVWVCTNSRSNDANKEMVANVKNKQKDAAQTDKEDVTQGMLVLERSLVRVASRDARSGLLILGRDGATRLHFSRPYDKFLAHDQVRFIPSPVGDLQERDIIEAFFDPTFIVFLDRS
jgi:hypothetical protein